MISPAKINLGLKILYKRRDGYHEIQSVFLLTDWGDEIQFKESNEFELFTELEPNLPRKNDFEIVSERGDVTKNILYKTFLKAKSLEPKILGVKILLKKKIPTGGGLGGGSSNAAQLLKYFFHLKYPKPFDSNFLSECASIGADVPFFLKGKSSMVTGIGERIEEIDTPSWSGILVFPNFGINTKEAFASLKKPLQETVVSDDGSYLLNELKNLLRYGDLKKFHSLIENDFEQYVTKSHPELLKLKHEMYELGMGYVSMSGSGSCFYGLITDETKIPIIIETLRDDFRDFQFVSFKTL